MNVTPGSPHRQLSTVTEKLLRQERLVVVAGICLLLLLSWWYLLGGAGTGMDPRHMTTSAFPPPPLRGRTSAWGIDYWLLMLLMWWVMMIAMMLPSAAPTVLLFARVQRHNQAGQAAVSAAPTGSFLAGYLLAWLLFSAAATFLQWLLERAGLLHSMLMWSSSTTLSAIVLLLAGAYQFTPAKRTCLRHCRGPAVFLSRHWRPGARGALAMGLHHGLFCVACCWAMMLLLFVGGVMNLLWIAGLALLVLLEKLLPNGERLSRVFGLAALLAGLYLLLLWTPAPATG
ncbi:DUF2182 domain-containing protein [Haliea sp. E17]|uniref:DUF2182 domain-containing protein n=1 Tax=Haliea sp. E17 TaxID=3401576 RepID=UPI003AAA32BB